MINVEFAKIPKAVSTPHKALGLFVRRGEALPRWAQALESGPQLARALEQVPDSHKTLTFYGTALAEVVTLGLCEAEMTEERTLALGATMMRVLMSHKVSAATWVAPERAAELVMGAHMAGYRFQNYKSDKAPSVERLTVLTTDVSAARAAFEQHAHLYAGVALARDLVSEPPNVLTPQAFAQRLVESAPPGLEVTVFDEEALATMGLRALLAVGQGSVNASRLGILHWRGGCDDQAPVALVGKGVTFDTGGISLKPGPGMEAMKWDMAGAGAVAGVMHALARSQARAHVVGVVGLVENMPDGGAQRPGDIVTTLSGQTVEIHNTDAEGRMVLADALWHTHTTYHPRCIVDLATLTGAIVVALGHEYAGLFSNDDDLAQRLERAGLATDEKLWRLPLHGAYAKLLESGAADMKNIGGRGAGAITAAQFLEKFTQSIPWAHLDIAGVAWRDKAAPLAPQGASGFGVRLLDRFVRDVFA